MISMTSEADISIQSTLTQSSRTFKVDDNNSDRTSPGSIDSCSIASKLSVEAVPRSKSTDCLEKKNSQLTPGTGAGSVSGSPVGEENLVNVTDGQKSPVQRIGVSVVGNNVLAEMKAKQEKRSSGLFSSNSATSSISNTSSNFTVLNKLKHVEEKESLSVSSSNKTEMKLTTNTNLTSSVTNYSSSASKSELSSVSVSKTKEQFSGNKGSIVANAAATFNSNVTSANNVNKRPPPVAPKPRPWSVVGSDRRSGLLVNYFIQNHRIIFVIYHCRRILPWE